MKPHKKFVVCAVGILLLVLAAGCNKKVSVAAPAPPPATPVAEKPDPPTISEFAVDPGLIELGQTAELRWQVTGATQSKSTRESVVCLCWGAGRSGRASP